MSKSTMLNRVGNVQGETNFDSIWAAKYEHDYDFMGLFEADTFDVEVDGEGVWRGYVLNEQGEQVLAAEYNYETNVGWWDESVL